jgi:23S rRNA (cytosine1962-C5)-methyltransferase
MSEPSQPSAKSSESEPWVQLRSVAYQTFVYKKMIAQASRNAHPGDIVAVRDRRDQLVGRALFNPKSIVALRMLTFDDTPIDDAFWRRSIQQAVDLRTQTLNIEHRSDAYRLIHAEGDELSGLIVDRFDDTISVEVFSLGIWKRIESIVNIIHDIAGTEHHLIRVDDIVQKREGFIARPIQSPNLPATVRITENGVRFRVHFESGHKTGFFCDQRQNRRRLADFSRGKDVLDLCAYTGGFGITAMKIGQASSVTCVDLDERSIDAARTNANLNQVRATLVKADAFTYMRQMKDNDRTFDVVVLDPPKLVFSRSDTEKGRHKYSDFNRLAATLVKPGGLLLTCSCSGLVQRDEFDEIVISAIRHAGRQTQIIDATAAAPDHPVSVRCPESAYLKALWLRVF